MSQSLSFLQGHHLRSELSKYIGNFITFIQRFPLVTNPIADNSPSTQLRYNDYICNIDLLAVLSECLVVKQTIKDNTYTTHTAICARYVNDVPIEGIPVTIYIARLSGGGFVAEFYVNDSGHAHVPENITAVRLIQQDGQTNAYITSKQEQYHFIYCSTIVVNAVSTDSNGVIDNMPNAKVFGFHLNKTVTLQVSKGASAWIVSGTSCFIALKYLLNFLDNNLRFSKTLADQSIAKSMEYIRESLRIRNEALSKILVNPKLEKLLTKFYIDYENTVADIEEVTTLPKNRNLSDTLRNIASEALAIATGDRS